MLATAAGMSPRRFPAEFQRHRRKVRGSGLRDLSTDLGRSGKKQVIERQTDKSLAHIHAAGHYAQFIRCERSANQAVQELGEVGSQFRRFEKNPVASCEGRKRWPHR